MADHKSERVMAAILYYLRAEPVANENIYRDMTQYVREVTDTDKEAIFLSQGGEEVIQYVAPDIVDIALTVYIKYETTGRAAFDSPAEWPANYINNLRRDVSIVLLGGGAAPPYLNQGSYLYDIEYTGAGDMELNETGDFPIANQTETWIFRYRRNRIDPSL